MGKITFSNFMTTSGSKKRKKNRTNFEKKNFPKILKGLETRGSHFLGYHILNKYQIQISRNISKILSPISTYLENAFSRPRNRNSSKICRYESQNFGNFIKNLNLMFIWGSVGHQSKKLTILNRFFGFFWILFEKLESFQFPT